MEVQTALDDTEVLVPLTCKPEITHKRDLKYNDWHRTLGRGYSACNIDFAEVRRGKIVEIHEVSECEKVNIDYIDWDFVNNYKKFHIPVFTEIAVALKVPAKVVFYNSYLSKFKVFTFYPRLETPQYYTQSEWANYLKNL